MHPTTTATPAAAGLDGGYRREQRCNHQSPVSRGSLALAFRGLQGGRSATSLTHRRVQIAREGHVMIRTPGLRGLVVAVFAGRAGMAATPAMQADPPGVQSKLHAVTAQGVG